MPFSHQPKQNLAEGGAAKIKVNPNPTIRPDGTLFNISPPVCGAALKCFNNKFRTDLMTLSSSMYCHFGKYYMYARCAYTFRTSGRDSLCIFLTKTEQSRAAERFTWSEFQPIPPKGADLRLLWSPVVTAISLELEHSMAG